jgi:hypothetical protein
MEHPLKPRGRATRFVAAVLGRLAGPAPTPRLLADLAPAFAEELADLLEAHRQPVLARSVSTLAVVQLCHCEDARCSSFYTVPRSTANWRWQQSGRTLDLDARVGTVNVDIAGQEIISVEVLDRPDLVSTIKAALEHRPRPRRDDQQHRNT